MAKKVEVEEKVQLPELLAEFRSALEKEIQAIKKGGQSSTMLFGGREVPSNGSDYWYSFKVEYMPDLPADTPCKLTVDNVYFDVTVISVSDNVIVLSSNDKLPDNIGKAKLDNGSTVLMERLIKRIEDNAESHNAAAERMLETENLDVSSNYTQLFFNSIDKVIRDRNNNNEQDKALLSSINNDITYIWGPPGTGKTTVIKDIILNLLYQERSVLLVSHTNTAVDGAIKKVDETYYKENGVKTDEQYPILRLGNISGLDISPRIRIENHIKQAGKELQDERERLTEDKFQAEKKLAEVSKNLFKFSWVEKNQIESIQTLQREIYQLKERNLELTRKKTGLVEKLELAKLTHPEYKDYLAVAKKLKQAKGKLSSLDASYEQQNYELNNAKTLIKDSIEAIACWKRYIKLEHDYANCLPIDLQRSNIEEINRTQSDLKSKRQEIESKLSTERENLDKNSQRRGLLGGVMTKRVVERIKENIKQLEVELIPVNQELESIAITSNTLNAELLHTLSLKSQMDILKVTESKSYWEDTLDKATSAQKDIEGKLEAITPVLQNLRKEVERIERDAEVKKPAFQLVLSLSNEIRLLDNEISKLDIATYVNDVEERIELEKHNYFTVTGNTLTTENVDEAIDLLEAKIIEVIDEIAGIDYSTLQIEEKNLKEEIKDISAKITEIEIKLDELKKAVILNAKVVGTTLAKSYLDDTIQSRKFDTVILDEASMASIPALWCASLLAETNIVIVGDFMQLPPIVIADGKSKEAELATKWLGRDIFEASGMQSRLKSNKNKVPQNFIALTSQYRMEAEIAEIANIYYGEYNTHLISPGVKMPFRCEERESFYSWYPMPRNEAVLNMVDTSNLNAWATGVPRGKGHSRLNYFNASLCVEMAFRFLGNKLKEQSRNITPSILIVAPYKPHVARIKELIELKYRTLGLPDDSNFIEVGTVHSFQGKEADIVIFDLVVDEPHWKANIFMTDDNVNNGIKKLYNVAVTRAKFKLYIVGNFKYFRQRAKNNALSELLDTLERNNARWIDAKDNYPELSFSMNLGNAYSLDDVKEYMSCTENQFFNYFCEDIKRCKRQLVIYSPFMTENRISTLLPFFVDLINAGASIIVVTKTMNEHSKAQRTSYQKCEHILNKNGIHIIHKKGMHEKNIFIDSDVMWCGSLNALSFTGNTGEYMLRIRSSQIASDSMKELGCNELVIPTQKPKEHSCPICKSEMIAAESGDGGFYWTCSSCEYSRNKEEPYPYDGYIKCPKCGSSLSFDMKNEPRWVCVENSKHYKKLKINDLRLPNMEALLKPKDIKRLAEYFLSSEKDTVRKAWEKYENRKKDASSSKKFEQLSLFDET